jgi:SAM-dependent methyltransferase
MENKMRNEKERLFQWSEDSIQWYKVAAEHETYHQNLAESILSRLPENPTICDMGCGAGYLSLALAPYAKEVEGVDLDPNALQVLKDNIIKKNISNISTRLGDFELLPPPKQQFDAIVMCLFGGLTGFMQQAMDWTSGKVIYITSAKSKHVFSASKEKIEGSTVEEISDYLEKNHYDFEAEIITLPFGQPLESFKDGFRFIRHYDKSSTDEEIKLCLKKKLVEYHRSDYPLYFPNEKKLAMFVIEANHA